MKLINIFKHLLLENSTSTYKYGCVMLYFDFPELQDIQNLIDPEDIYSEEGPQTYGLEDEPHVTLLYGLHEEVTPLSISNVIHSHNFGTVWLYEPSLFSQPNYDVFKFKAVGDSLHQVNRQLRQYPHTTSFPEYNPHLTIGYLKPGTVKKYIPILESKKLHEFELSPLHAVYSTADGKKHRINLGSRG